MKSLFFISFIILLLILVCPSGISAYNFEEDSGLDKTGGKEGTGHTEIGDIGVNSIFRLIMPLVGVAYLILMIYAGYLWMGAQGNEEQVKRSRGIIISATLGLIIAFASYAIAFYVVSTFQEGLIK